jgi:hypothetical protein
MFLRGWLLSLLPITDFLAKYSDWYRNIRARLYLVEEKVNMRKKTKGKKNQKRKPVKLNKGGYVLREEWQMNRQLRAIMADETK